MKKLISSILVAVSAVVMVSCAKDDGGGQVVVNPTCGTGQYWNGTMCVYSNGVSVNTPVRYYDYNRYFTNNYWGGIQTQNGDMTIVNTGAFKEFLKQAMAVCDRNIWGAEYGLAKCDSWVSGSFQVEFSVDSTLKPMVTFTAYPEPRWYQYTLSFGINGGGYAFNPLVLNESTFSLINNSKGFEIRTQGSYWNGGGLKLIQIQVQQGTLNDGYFTYDIYFPYNDVPTKIVSGKFKRR